MPSTWITDGGDTMVDDSANTLVFTQGPALSDEILTLLDASVGAAYRDGSAQVVYVLKASPMNLVTSQIEDLYFASTTFRTDSTDTPANTPMLGGLTPPNVRVSVLSGGRIGSKVSVSRGEIKIANVKGLRNDRNDALVTAGRGRYDSYRMNYDWDGRATTMYIGPEDGAFATDFAEYFSAQVGAFNWADDAITITPTAGVVDLDAVVQRNVYGQGYVIESSGPGGSDSITYSTGQDVTKSEVADAKPVESITVFDDLSNVPKPLAYGRVYGVEPQVIAKANEIYQYHTGADDVLSLDAVYEDGLEFTEGTDYESNVEDGLFQLDSGTTGIVTVDVRGAKSGPSGAYINKPGQISRAVLYNHCGVVPADLATETLAQYDALFSYETGYHFGSEHVTRNEFLEEMLRPLGFPFRGRDNRLRVGWAQDPTTATADLTLAEKDIKSITRRGTMRPVWRVRIGYQPVGKVIEWRDFAGAVTEGERARQGNEYRWVEARDDGIVSLHKADELVLETRFTAKADAQALADSVLAVYGRQRHIVEVSLNHKFMQYDIGDVVRLGYNRYDFIDDGFLLQENGDKFLLENGSDFFLKEEDAAGTNFMVVGYVDNPANADFSITLWG